MGFTPILLASEIYLRSTHWSQLQSRTLSPSQGGDQRSDSGHPGCPRYLSTSRPEPAGQIARYRALGFRASREASSADENPAVEVINASGVRHCRTSFIEEFADPEWSLEPLRKLKDSKENQDDMN